MADTLQTNGKATALAIGGNRMSTRSTRKKKTTMLSPKKFCDFVIGKTPGKSFEAGVAELYKEYYLESPTFINYFRAPKEKNASESVWLYDQTRVIVPDLEYYHASWVDGLRPNQYILAQAPRDEAAAKDFFKMVDHVKAEAIIIVESSDDFSSQIAPKFEKLPTKKGEKGTDDLSTAVIKDHGKNLKAVKFNRADQMAPAELVEMVERTRKYLGSPLKGPTVIICRDGATRCGVVAFIDLECDRLTKYGRVKHGDTIKAIRFTRCNTFDTFEAYDFAINSLVELCHKQKKK
ncbi:hypothetical protein CRE_30674 [Caenorhabditis remanei]|uniref:Uncharacterized protein n=1 Tax=Caenorhabditis remanei TaxID=31234 RepID=E3LTN7_CAERE|nr:hypothetical protein CRE_30674 [Caenorhabditis remanei]